MICDRCGADVRLHTMSRFNTDELCMACADDERQLSSFSHAAAAEVQACKRGDFNFKGVGLRPFDRMELDKLRKKRTPQSESSA